MLPELDDWTRVFSFTYRDSSFFSRHAFELFVSALVYQSTNEYIDRTWRRRAYIQHAETHEHVQHLDHQGLLCVEAVRLQSDARDDALP